MDFKNSLLVAWKYCWSFRKSNWEIEDYPIVIREMETDLDLDLGPDIKPDRYLAQIVNWWVVSGGGESRQEARKNLASSFEEMKDQRRRDGKLLPRPGTSVPLEFASSERVSAHPELLHDFLERVLETEWAFVSDGSSLWEFVPYDSRHILLERIRETYGVDASDIESGNLAEVLERIAENRNNT